MSFFKYPKTYRSRFYSSFNFVTVAAVSEGVRSGYGGKKACSAAFRAVSAPRVVGVGKKLCTVCSIPYFCEKFKSIIYVFLCKTVCVVRVAIFTLRFVPKTSFFVVKLIFVDCDKAHCEKSTKKEQTVSVCSI